MFSLVIYIEFMNINESSMGGCGLIAEFLFQEALVKPVQLTLCIIPLPAESAMIKMFSNFFCLCLGLGPNNTGQQFIS